MNTAISLTDRETTGPLNLDHLMVELDHYRRQSEWLKQVNELHARLAGATDLQGMIEAFSVWLTPWLSMILLPTAASTGAGCILSAPATARTGVLPCRPPKRFSRR